VEAAVWYCDGRPMKAKFMPCTPVWRAWLKSVPLGICS
jgi:hypothetical protein